MKPGNGSRQTEEANAKQYGIQLIPGRSAKGLGKDVIHYGNNSGYQAINVAFLKGAKRIILLGYDMQKTGGEVHFFGDHPSPLCNGPRFDSIMPLFNQLAADLATQGVEVINCTRQTALQAFKRQTLEQVLDDSGIRCLN